MGIKFRHERIDGDRHVRLEFKGRTSAMGVCDFGNGHAGCVERWVKWSYADSDVPGVMADLFDQSSNVVDIYKKRILRRLRLGTFREDVEVPLSGPEAAVDRGMHIELTRVRVGDPDARRAAHVGWTLGFEAFPHDAEMYDSFGRNVGVFLETFRGPILEAETSMSYPAWIHSFSS